MTEQEKRVCEYCNKTLQSFKPSNVNDWSARTLHKTCYKRLQQNNTFERLLLNYKLDYSSG